MSSNSILSSKIKIPIPFPCNTPVYPASHNIQLQHPNLFCTFLYQNFQYILLIHFFTSLLKFYIHFHSILHYQFHLNSIYNFNSIWIQFTFWILNFINYLSFTTDSSHNFKLVSFTNLFQFPVWNRFVVNKIFQKFSKFSNSQNFRKILAESPLYGGTSAIS